MGSGEGAKSTQQLLAQGLKTGNWVMVCGGRLHATGSAVRQRGGVQQSGFSSQQTVFQHVHKMPNYITHVLVHKKGVYPPLQTTGGQKVMGAKRLESGAYRLWPA